MTGPVVSYWPGNVIRCSGSFTDINNNLIDPTDVLFEYEQPNGVVTTYNYPTDAQIVRDSTGNYHVDLSVSLSGSYTWRFYSTGSGMAAAERTFFVRFSGIT